MYSRRRQVGCWQEDGFVAVKGVTLVEKGLLVAEIRYDPAAQITHEANQK